MKNNNPFHNGTGIVKKKKHFVGRSEILEQLEDFAYADTHQNFALIGEPRIGKSSIVYQGLRAKKKALFEEKIFPIWITLSGYATPENFFFSLVESAYGELRKSGNDNARFDRIYQEVKTHKKAEWQELNSGMHDFFEEANDQEIKLIFILDEFDAARKLFLDKTEYFAGLRSLGDTPDHQVSLIITSRREIKLIERQTSDYNSTLHGIFDANTKYITPFEGPELDEYFNLFSQTDMQLSPEEKEHIHYYCGGNPFLLNALCYNYCRLFQKKQDIRVEEVFEEVGATFDKYYDHLIRLLKEDRRFENTLRILFSSEGKRMPVHDAKQLERYGIIRKDEEGEYVAFSGHFNNHLYSLGQDADFWVVWSESERLLRRLIRDVFHREQGKNWEEMLFNQHAEIWDRIMNRRREDNLPSDDLVTYLEPDELFEIIFHPRNWSLFEPVLCDRYGYDQDDWEERKESILRVRTPFFKNRLHHLTRPEIKQAELFCGELYRILNDYFKK